MEENRGVALKLDQEEGQVVDSCFGPPCHWSLMKQQLPITSLTSPAHGFYPSLLCPHRSETSQEKIILAVKERGLGIRKESRDVKDSYWGCPNVFSQHSAVSSNAQKVSPHLFKENFWTVGLCNDIASVFFPPYKEDIKYVLDTGVSKVLAVIILWWVQLKFSNQNEIWAYLWNFWNLQFWKIS